MIPIKKASIAKNSNGRISREMKTPSFGNNSGPDDHLATFKVNIHIFSFDKSYL